MKTAGLDPSIAILVLAAGGSSRMGKPKLIQKAGNSSIFETVIEKLKPLQIRIKLVVLGADKELYLPLVPPDFRVLINENWEKGLSSSIKAAVNHISDQNKEIEHVLIVLGDMPLITTEYLDLLIKSSLNSGKGIIASNYGPSAGPPVIFSKKYFMELSRIKGDKGAKSIFHKYSDDMLSLDFKDGLIDIDSPEDLAKLRRRGTNFG